MACCALAGAWQARVLAEEVVNHASRHGFTPSMPSGSAAYFAEALGRWV